LSHLFAAHLALAGVRDRSVAEARIILEQGIAFMAAENRTRKDLAAIRDAIKRFGAVGDDRAKLIDADQRFHNAVLESAHNPILLTFRELLTIYFFNSLLNIENISCEAVFHLAGQSSGNR